MREGHQLPGQLPAGGRIGLQQAVPHEFIWVRCVVGKAVHHVANVVEDVRGHLGQYLVPLCLRRHDMGAAEDRVRLLKPPLRLFGIKGEELDRNMRAGLINHRVSSGGTGGGVHRGANMCSGKMRGKAANRGRGGRWR